MRYRRFANIGLVWDQGKTLSLWVLTHQLRTDALRPEGAHWDTKCQYNCIKDPSFWSFFFVKQKILSHCPFLFQNRISVLDSFWVLMSICQYHPTTFQIKKQGFNYGLNLRKYQDGIEFCCLSNITESTGICFWIELNRNLNLKALLGSYCITWHTQKKTVIKLRG